MQYRYVAPSALRAAPPMGSQERSAAKLNSIALEGKAAIREYHLLKKGGEAATRVLNLEPNESKVKRSCEEMNPHFFTAPFFI